MCQARTWVAVEGSCRETGKPCRVFFGRLFDAWAVWDNEPNRIASLSALCIACYLRKILSPKYLITNNLKIMAFLIINGNPNTSILSQELAQKLEARIHHVEPG